MKIKDNLKNIIDMFKRMTLQEIQMYKYTLMALLVVDLIGIYWYFQLKALGIALMLVIMGFLAVFLFLEKNVKGGRGNMTNNENKQETSEDIQKEIESLEKKKKLKTLSKKRDILKEDIDGEEEYKDLTPEPDEDNSFSLPNAKEFDERARKALGDPIF